jgi:hypothetical protein
MFKVIAFKILLLIFLANFFYEENQVFLYKRVIYSFFIYWAVYEIANFNWKAITEDNTIKLPSFFPGFIVIYLLFILFNVLTDLRNPNLNFVTLINNPQAALSVVPVFVFFVGVYSTEFTEVYKLLKVICIIFLISWVVQLPGRIPFYQGFIASHAILPFFLISMVDKKKMTFAALLIVAAAAFSLFSGYRIVLLKVLFFSGLFFSLNLVKNVAYLKVIIIVAASTFLFLMLNNLQDMLELFKGFIGNKEFETNDTRSFLYEELFSDMGSSELIFGRGFLGTYFSEYFLMLIQNNDDTGDFYQRFGVEVGFLQLILKGGFLYYFLYTLPLWFVAIRSIFWFSKLKIPFFIGIYILTELMLMFFENIPYFNFQFSVLFLFAGFAYRITYLSDRARQSPVIQSLAAVD